MQYSFKKGITKAGFSAGLVFTSTYSVTGSLRTSTIISVVQFILIFVMNYLKVLTKDEP